MPKLIALVLYATLFATAAAFSADGDEKQKMSTIAPVENLVSAAGDKMGALEKYVADPETFSKSSKMLKRDAGVVAVLSQAIAEHDQESPLKKSAVPLRDAALKLASAGSHDDAAQLLKAMQQAQAGNSTGGEVQFDWSRLIDFDSLMSEISLRNRNVGRAVRKMRRGLDQSARDEIAEDADVLAVLGLVVAADTSPVKEKDEIAGWTNYAAEQRTAAMETATAFRNNDADGCQTAYIKLAKTCSGCHKAFRE